MTVTSKLPPKEERRVYKEACEMNNSTQQILFNNHCKIKILQLYNTQLAT